MQTYRTHKCNELNEEHVGESVKLSGFVKTIRDLGSVLFVDLRDHYGITQLVTNNEEMITKMRKVPIESTICIEGKVLRRDVENQNPIIETGKIEVSIDILQILGKVEKMLPFKIEDSHFVREDLRLEYRFLDLRNEEIHKKIVFRAKVLKSLRNRMDNLGFVEIQTPILANSSPEGARDFLVPSRLHPGEFYALPQAPQQFKQLLMISGFDKYYQVAPCFRDEDPRADRSPGEFYQLDFEMSFANQDQVMAVLEEVVGSTFKEFAPDNKVSNAPFIRIPYKEAIDKYGIDKPDLRNPLIIQDVSKAFENSEFRVFKGKTVKAIKINALDVSRKFFDEMVDHAMTKLDMSGLAWIKIAEDSQIVGPIAKFMVGETLENLKDILDFKVNDAIFFTADTNYTKACTDAGAVRIELGKRLDILEKKSYKFCFINDFPMYELDDDGKIAFNHNPFSMPIGGMDALLNEDPLDINAYQFDLVCNGYELASGAVRNHETDVMVKAFEIAGYEKEEVEKRFGSLFNAFKFGAPPHAGAAPGIDRMIMLLLEETNIREVIAFPKNSKARDLLMCAPSIVKKEQLNDVHIKIIEDKK
ncbi:MAG: aspartate--tRNA ligase [Clostridia bacterium]